MLKSRLLAAVGIAVVGGITGLRAVQGSGSPGFDVASVKPSQTTELPGVIDVIPGHLRIPNNSVRRIILAAYGLVDYQLADTPSWTTTEHFAINATFTAGSSPTRSEAMVMLQKLLADRFSLVAHREVRPSPTYALVLARKDGKLGPWMVRSDTDCKNVIADRTPGLASGLPSPVSPDRKRPPCTIRQGPDFLTGGGQTTADIAKILQLIAARPVVDQTGLAGAFNFDLKFTRSPVATPALGGADIAPSPNDAPSIFTAVQEQLGLKLDSQRAPLDVLVVDHVERPTED